MKKNNCKIMKLYEFRTTEHNGEQEYSHYHLVYAKSLNEAECNAKAFCATWYDDEDVRYNEGELNDSWEFFGGDVVLYFDRIEECQPTDWKESRFNDALISSDWGQLLNNS